MARRTKKDKLIAQLRRQVQLGGSDPEPSYSLPVSANKPRDFATPSLSVSTDTAGDFLSLFSYDPAFIKKDLIRTAILTVLAFFVEFGLYYWLR